ncbi:MAG: formate dehydrogenase accessory sulfurtransferase FdhD [Anaerolineae bacterium]
MTRVPLSPNGGKPQMRSQASPAPDTDCEGTARTRYITITRSGWEEVPAAVIHERLVCIYVNGQELVSIMCSPCQLEALALGFLANEGIIASLDDVRTVEVRPNNACIDVWLAYSDFEPPRRRTLTSGCGGGVTFEDLSAGFPALESDRRVTPGQLWALMDLLHQAAQLYSQARGVHTSAISDGERLLLTAEDVGRHNTLDKLRGLALQAGIDTRDHIILTTGRVSSEMINKARRMGVPVVCSRTSPTSLSVGLAESWNITLVGYLRRNSMNVYAHPERMMRVSAPSGDFKEDS